MFASDAHRRPFIQYMKKHFLSAALSFSGLRGVPKGIEQEQRESFGYCQSPAVKFEDDEEPTPVVRVSYG